MDEVLPVSQAYDEFLAALEAAEAAAKKVDRCWICHGTRGGVPGNENWVDGILMCDYCHSERSHLPYPWCWGNPTKDDCRKAGYCRRNPNCGD